MNENKINFENIKVVIFDFDDTLAIHKDKDYLKHRNESVIEKRQGFKIGCIEEIAYRNGFINEEKLLENAVRYGKSGYGDYLKNLIK